MPQDARPGAEGYDEPEAHDALPADGAEAHEEGLDMQDHFATSLVMRASKQDV